MKFHTDRTLRFWLDVEYERKKDTCPNLTRPQIVRCLLFAYEQAGHARRYLRKDGKIGWRSTDLFREHLFEQAQAAVD